MKKNILVSTASLVLALFLASSVHAQLQTKVIKYKYAGKTLVGYLAFDDTKTSVKKPGVLVVHEFWGLNGYAKKRTEQLASMGYVAFAADMYGDGKTAKHPEEAMGMMTVVTKNQKIWLGRAQAALKVLQSQPNVDVERIAAIGYCFGGATVQKLAYSGADVKAVASFHGVLVNPDENVKDVKSKILILQGADDPYSKPEVVKSFKASLDKAKLDYKYISYPKVVHSFTVPEAGNDPSKGVAYNAKADKKSWNEMKRLFAKTINR